MSFKKKSVLNTITLILLSVTIISIYLLNCFTNTMGTVENTYYEGLIESINNQMNNQFLLAKTNAQSIVNNVHVKELLKNQDREGLYNLTYPIYKKLDKEFSQAQFHLPNSVSFLRLHQPDKFGDNLKDFRPSVNLVNEKKEEVIGLEEGVAGLGFRAVLPIDYNGQHLGSFEYGGEFQHGFIEKLQDEFKGEYVIYGFDNSLTPRFISSTEAQDSLPIEGEEDLKKVKDEKKHLIKFAKDRRHVAILIPLENYQTEVIGYLKVILNRTKVIDQLRSTKINYLIFLFIIIILACIFTIFKINKSLEPLYQLIDTSKLLAEGDLTQYIDESRTDEFGDLARAFNRIIENLRNILLKITEMSQTVASTSEELSANSEELSASSNMVLGSISHVTDASEEQLGITTKASKNMKNIIKAIDILNMNVEKINKTATTTIKSTQDGLSESEEVKKRVLDLEEYTKNTIDSIKVFKETSNEIRGIVGVLGAISKQTQLLALNAGIEAARAGEHGKGFSVVAEEVRVLSEESNKFSSEIENLINNIEASISKAVGLMDTSIVKVNESVEMVSKFNDKFNLISDDIYNIVGNINSVSILVDNMHNNTTSMTQLCSVVVEKANKVVDENNYVENISIDQNNALDQIAHAIEDLALLATDLQEQIGIFKI